MSASTTNRWKLGLFVVVGIAMLIGALGWLGAGRLQQQVLVAYTFFDEAVDGLTVGSPVKFRGVPIGSVVEIRAVRAPERRQVVEVRAELYVDSLTELGLFDPDNRLDPAKDPFVPPQVRTQLVSSFLTGVAFIQTDYFDPTEHPVQVFGLDYPWETVHSVPSTTKQLEKNLTDALSSLPRLAEQAERLLHKIETNLDETDVPGAVRSARELIETADGKLEELDLLAFRDAVAEIRDFVSELRAEDGPVKGLVARVKTTLDRFDATLADARLDATSGSVREAATSVAELGQGAERLIPVLRETLAGIRDLAELLERDPGALIHGKTTGTGGRRDR